MTKPNCWFPHDSGAHRDTRIIKLRMKFGYEGYGVYWALIELMREQDNYCLKWDGQDDIDAIAYHLQCKPDALAFIVNHCIESKLMSMHDSYLTSKALLKRMERLDEVSEERRKAANKRWNNKDLDPKAMQLHTQTDAIAMQVDAITRQDSTIQNNIKENKKEEKKEGGMGETTPALSDVFKTLGIEQPKPEPKIEAPITVDPLAKFRDKLLQPTGNEPWEKNNLYINAGKTPMKDYPSIWLTAHELKNVVEVLEETFPGQNWKPIFREAQAEIDLQLAKNNKSAYMGAYKYLTTFCLENALKRTNEKTKLERSQGYVR